MLFTSVGVDDAVCGRESLVESRQWKSQLFRLKKRTDDLVALRLRQNSLRESNGCAT